MRRAWIFAALLSASACGEETADYPAARPQSDPTPTFGYVQEVFAMSCTFSQCHTGKRPAGDMSLAPDRAYVELVNVESWKHDYRRVVPGDPDSSLLAMLIEGPVGSTDRMPDLSPKLDADIRAAIRGWIEGGALQN